MADRVHHFDFTPNRGNQVMFKPELLPETLLHLVPTRPYLYLRFRDHLGVEWAVVGDHSRVHIPYTFNRCPVPLAACSIFR